MLRKLLYVLVALLLAACSFPSLPVNPRDTVVLIKGNHALCSAVIVGPGRLLTAAHCMDVTSYVVYHGIKVPYTKKYVNEKQDLAFIEAVGVECPCSPILFEQPKVDEIVYKYGYALYPSVLMLNRTVGEYQGQIEMVEGQKWMFHTAPAAPGDSGGGVFVKRFGVYYLVGITSTIANLEEIMIPQLVFHMGLAVPMSTLRQ